MPERILDDIDGLDGKIAELRENLRRRFTLDGLNIEKRYRDGDLYLMTDLVDRASGQLFEFIFGALPKFPGWRQAFSEPKLGIAQRHSNADKVGVFIDQIEVMENAEKIAVPSVVWLQRGDSATDAFGNFLAFLS